MNLWNTNLSQLAKKDKCIGSELSKNLEDFSEIIKQVKVTNQNETPTLTCDCCKLDFKYSSDTTDEHCEILHSHGFIDGVFSHHIHICYLCAEKYDISGVNIITNTSILD